LACISDEGDAGVATFTTTGTASAALDRDPGRTASRGLASPRARAPLSAAEAHAAHADFVWRSLARLGVKDADLPDMLQEVFLVVHRRAHAFDGSSKLTSWLFGICLRVAAAYRRRAHRRYERPLEPALHPVADEAESPEAALQNQQARERLDALLDALPLDKRAVFVMFEIDGMSCAEIAHDLGVPVGTVHSRLHAARAVFAKALARARAIEARRR
jgi:RNA polymerase sigma-70 factor, ECF subfamily